MLTVIGILMTLPFIIPLPDLEKNIVNLKQPFPESHFVNIDNNQIHYRYFETTATKRGNIFFVHGFSGSTFTWRKNIDTCLKSGYDVIAVDLPSFGYSCRNLDLNQSQTNRAVLMWKLISTIQPKEKINLVGHSMGGGVVMAMASINPDKTQSVVFVDGVGGNILKEKSEKIFGKITFGNSFTRRWSEVAGAYYFYNYKSFKKLLGSAYGQEPDSLAVVGYMQPFYIKNTASAILGMSGYSFEIENVELEKIKTPTKIIWGEKDQWVPISIGEKTKNKITNSEFSTIKNAGHCGMETHSDEFNKLLIEFLNKNNSNELK